MNLFDSIIPLEADKKIKELEHNVLHIQTLLTEHPELHTYQDPKSGEIFFYSSMINSQADNVEFSNFNPSGYSNFHFAHPFKIINIDCHHCEGIIKMGSSPARIPLFVFYGSSYYPGENQIYSLAYEDFMKNSNIPQDIIGKSHLYILSFLEEQGKQGIKLNSLFLNNSVKKLLPFT